MSQRRPDGACHAPEFHSHEGEAQWIAAAVSDIAAALQHDLDASGRARLLLSGGSTPAPVYEALAQQSLEWSRIEIALVDERWLPAGSADSNATLVRNTLLKAGASGARFEAMLLPGRELSETVLAANASSSPASVVVLGMGPDGHTASLFPQMRGLDAALDSAADYVAVDASGCPGAGPWPQRISITPAGLARSGTRVLLVRGEHKRVVLQQAGAGDDPHELPIRIALRLPGAPLRIHWCP